MTKTISLLLLLLSTLAVTSAQTVARLKDIARLQGVRKNQLIGTGLVIGLKGTGDKTTMTRDMVMNTMKNLGMQVQEGKLDTKNAAAVIITAEYSAFTTPGDTIDVTVSTMGDASSLQGGILVQTPLKGADGLVYAVAQGALSIGGKDPGPGQENHKSVAKIPGGGIVERELPMQFTNGDTLFYLLQNPDFTTANRIADSINQNYGVGTAIAMNSAKIKVKIPYSFQSNPVEYVSLLGGMEVMVDQKARVIINERTGTVVLGGNVKIAPLAIAHGTMMIQVGNPLNRTGTPERVVNMDQASTVQDLVNTLNLMGINTSQLIAIIQEIKNSGALQASLEIL